MSPGVSISESGWDRRKSHRSKMADFGVKRQEKWPQTCGEYKPCTRVGNQRHTERVNNKAEEDQEDCSRKNGPAVKNTGLRKWRDSSKRPPSAEPVLFPNGPANRPTTWESRSADPQEEESGCNYNSVQTLLRACFLPPFAASNGQRVITVSQVACVLASCFLANPTSLSVVVSDSFHSLFPTWCLLPHLAYFFCCHS